MLLSATLWFTFIATVINGHNHEIVIIVDNSLSLTSSECIQQQTAISDLFKDYKNVNISNDVSYISFSHYQSDFTQLISFKDIQNDTKSIENLASKIKTFDCNQHILTKKIKNNHHKSSFNQLLNVLKYAISSYQNHTKTKRILLFNNFATSTKSQEEICEYFIQNNKQNLHMDIKYEPNTFDDILALVSVNVMGHGVNKYYLKCNQTYIKKNITLNNSSLTTFNANHYDLVYSVCQNNTNGTCENCLKHCAGDPQSCPADILDTCDVYKRCAMEASGGGPVCCGTGLMDECCEEDDNGNMICTPTDPTDFCGIVTGEPSLNPSIYPTSFTSNPSRTPSSYPSRTPSSYPSRTPTSNPTGLTLNPSKSPTVDDDDDSSSSRESNDNAMRSANILDSLNSNDEMSGTKSQNVMIKLDSLTSGALWMIIGIVTFCIILICCACKRTIYVRYIKEQSMVDQFEPNTI